MGNVQPEEVEGFYEYGTKLASVAVIASQRKGHILSKTELKI